MLQLKNPTGLQAIINAFPNVNGIDSLYVAVKATFSLSSTPHLLELQPPFILADEHYGEPDNSSIAKPSEAHLCKPRSDILLVGHACAPGCRPSRLLDTELAVANQSMAVRVWGDRVWDNGKISPPEIFEKMPLTYERAFGGVVHDPESGQVIAACAENPVGTGLTQGKSQQAINGLALPNLENPQQAIESLKTQPKPVGFGSIASSWQPRASFAGTYDDNWQENRAPYLPLDFNPQFFNVAHPDLIYPNYLQGGEAVRLINLHEDGPVNFTLPRLNIQADVVIDNAKNTMKPNLETLSIDTNSSQFSLIWRTEITCDKKLLKVQEIAIACEGLNDYQP